MEDFVNEMMTRKDNRFEQEDRSKPGGVGDIKAKVKANKDYFGKTDADEKQKAQLEFYHRMAELSQKGKTFYSQESKHLDLVYREAGF